LHAAIHLPHDGVGNCRHFTHLLKSQAQRLGASFHFETDVRSVRAGPRPGLTLVNGDERAFDGIVIGAGVQANALLSGIGLRLPLAAVHGYSVTAPLRHIDGLPQLGPRSALMDERYKIAVTRLGQRIRVSGGAELGGKLDHMAAAPLRTLYRVLDDWFAGAALTREAQHWKGARPMLPDGPPLVGESGAPGVWLNLGHGASGWALACGSARLLADRIAGREPPLDTSLLSLGRLR
jgi:D-amino-acid dehydrogenase